MPGKLPFCAPAAPCAPHLAVDDEPGVLWRVVLRHLRHGERLAGRLAAEATLATQPHVVLLPMGFLTVLVRESSRFLCPRLSRL